MIESAQGRNFWSGTRILKIFVGSVTDSLLEDKATVATLDELLLDPVDELVELSLELRMMVCDELLKSLRMLEELFSSLREFEELKAIHEELEDSGSGPE